VLGDFCDKLLVREALTTVLRRVSLEQAASAKHYLMKPPVSGNDRRRMGPDGGDCGSVGSP
jgi:hypothetical protein